MTTGAPQPVRRVVVPLDGSRFSTTALPHAEQFADRLDAALCLFSAVDTVDEHPDRRVWLASITVSRPVEHEVVVNRDPAGAVHEMLRRRPGSTVCMASRAHERAAALTRSVLTEILARGHDAVIAVGPAIGDVAPWLEHEPPRGVVVGVDDDGEATHLAELAADWAMQLHEPLTVVTIAEPLPPPLVGGPVHRRYGPDGDVGLFLRVLVAGVHREDVEIASRALYDPIGPSDGIVRWAREHPPVLVVIGTSAPTGLARFAKGSTAAAIVRRCAAPVLVVPTRVRRTEPRRRATASSARGADR